MTSDECPFQECDGKGYILYTDHEFRKIQEIAEDGQVVERFRKKDIAKVCRCREVVAVEKLIDSSAVPAEFKNATINSFKLNIYQTNESRQKAHVAKRAAINFVNEFETIQELGGKGLYLYSSIKGSGKTRMAASVMNALLRKYGKSHELTACYTPTADLLNAIRKNFGSESKVNAEDVIDAVKKADILVLDDIGVEKVTEWVEETFSRILDYRLQNKLMTIFTSNIRIDDLDNRYSEGRVKSRIEKMAFPVEFPNESIRSELAKEENDRMQELLLGGA